eukprot:365140-Chlamydomonas_euryale.AAC.7
MVLRQTLQWLGRVLRMEEGRWPRSLFGCSSAWSLEEGGRAKSVNVRQHHISFKNLDDRIYNPKGGSITSKAPS